MLKLQEATPFIIQTRIDAKERSEKGKALAKGEKAVNEVIDAFYGGVSTDNAKGSSAYCDKNEINSYIELN